MWARAEAEDDRSGAAAIAEFDSHARMASQGRVEDYLRDHGCPERPEEGPATRGDRARHDAATIDGSLDHQDRVRSRIVGKVGVVPGVARCQERAAETRLQCAVVEPGGNGGGGLHGSRERQGDEAVERSPPRREHFEGAAGEQRAGRFGRLARGEGREPGGGNEHHLAASFELGVARECRHGERPTTEGALRGIGVADDERARADHQVFLVLKRQRQGVRDVRGGGCERRVRLVAIGLRHELRSERRARDPENDEQHARGQPDVAARFRRAIRLRRVGTAAVPGLSAPSYKVAPPRGCRRGGVGAGVPKGGTMQGPRTRVGAPEVTECHSVPDVSRRSVGLSSTETVAGSTVLSRSFLAALRRGSRIRGSARRTGKRSLRLRPWEHEPPRAPEWQRWTPIAPPRRGSSRSPRSHGVSAYRRGR